MKNDFGHVHDAVERLPQIPAETATRRAGNIIAFQEWGRAFNQLSALADTAQISQHPKAGGFADVIAQQATVLKDVWIASRPATGPATGLKSTFTPKHGQKPRLGH